MFKFIMIVVLNIIIVLQSRSQNRQAVIFIDFDWQIGVMREVLVRKGDEEEGKYRAGEYLQTIADKG
ncbi:MAG: hypothetical protein ACRDCA_23360 [Serratia sp. (in: enterobacteria)]|uniref:hypothetical protein n=1 Tax=Serratia sp. (in: enterobacteria) TaxID=616 RepID=UPI003F410A70